MFCSGPTNILLLNSEMPQAILSTPGQRQYENKDYVSFLFVHLKKYD